MEERSNIKLAQISRLAGLILTVDGDWLADLAWVIRNRLKGLEADLTDTNCVIVEVLQGLVPCGFRRSDLAPLLAGFCALYPVLIIHLEFMDCLRNPTRLNRDIVTRLSDPSVAVEQEVTLITFKNRSSALLRPILI